MERVPNVLQTLHRTAKYVVRPPNRNAPAPQLAMFLNYGILIIIIIIIVVVVVITLLIFNVRVFVAMERARIVLPTRLPVQTNVAPKYTRFLSKLLY
jgi:heme/copper-type cytochrome/quinol oxidase subunit 2